MAISMKSGGIFKLVSIADGLQRTITHRSHINRICILEVKNLKLW